MKHLAVISVTSLALAIPASALAEPIRDGNAFEINPEGVTLCVLAPIEKRSPTGCEGLDVDPNAPVPPSPPERRVVFVAIARTSTDEGAPWALFSVHELPNQRLAEIDAKTAAETARGMTDGAAAAMKGIPGARVRPVVGSIVRSANGAVFRGKMDVDGIADDAPIQQVALQHSATYMLPRDRKNAYTVAWSMPNIHASAFDAVAERAIATARVDAPARPSAYDLGYKFGVLLFRTLGVLTLVGGSLVVIILAVRKRRPNHAGAQ